MEQSNQQPVPLTPEPEIMAPIDKTPTQPRKQSLTAASTQLLALAVCLIALASCTANPGWSSAGHLRNWEKLRTNGEQAQLEGKWAQAERLYKQAVSESMRSGIAPSMIAGTRVLLAESELHNGKTSEAASDFDQALAIYEQLTRSHVPLSPFSQLERANCAAGKARTIALLQAPEKSLEPFESAISMYKSIDHVPLELLKSRACAKCYANLADTYFRMHQIDKAKKAIALGQAQLTNGGSPHLQTEMRALAEKLSGETDSSLPTEQHAIEPPPAKEIPAAAADKSPREKSKISESKESWEVAYNSYRKANRSGNDIAIEKALLNCYESVKSLDASDIRKRTTVTELGNFYGSRHQWKQATPFYRELIELSKAAFGPTDKARLLPMNRLGRAYMNTGNLEGSQQILTEAMTEASKAPSIQGIPQLRIMETLAELRLKQKKYKDCEYLCQRASPLAEELKDFPTIKNIYTVQALSQLEQGNAAKARNLLERAAQVSEQHLGYEEQWDSQLHLAQACLKTDDWKSADSHYLQAENALLNAMAGTRLRTQAQSIAPAVFAEHAELLDEHQLHARSKEVRHQLLKALAESRDGKHG